VLIRSAVPALLAATLAAALLGPARPLRLILARARLFLLAELLALLLRLALARLTLQRLILLRLVTLLLALARLTLQRLILLRLVTLLLALARLTLQRLILLRLVTLLLALSAGALLLLIVLVLACHAASCEWVMRVVTSGTVRARSYGRAARAAAVYNGACGAHRLHRTRGP
jgi:hypothetical protein